MNPCRCGTAGANGVACRRGARCASDYQARISGPFMDRMDLHLQIPAVTPADLAMPPAKEGTADIAARVLTARNMAIERNGGCPNGELDTQRLDHVAMPDAQGHQLLQNAAQTVGLTARGYHRVLKLARTIADLDQSPITRRVHIGEALSYRRALPSSVPLGAQSGVQASAHTGF